MMFMFPRQPSVILCKRLVNFYFSVKKRYFAVFFFLFCFFFCVCVCVCVSVCVSVCVCVCVCVCVSHNENLILWSHGCPIYESLTISGFNYCFVSLQHCCVTLKAPITVATDSILIDIIANKAWHLMWIVSLADSSWHVKPYFLW